MTVPDEEFWCHVHNEDNEHVGTGKASTVSQALVEAVKDARTNDTNMRVGSFACNIEENVAHRLATKIQDEDFEVPKEDRPFPSV